MSNLSLKTIGSKKDPNGHGIEWVARCFHAQAKGSQSKDGLKALATVFPDTEGFRMTPCNLSESISKLINTRVVVFGLFVGGYIDSELDAVEHIELLFGVLTGLAVVYLMLRVKLSREYQVRHL